MGSGNLDCERERDFPFLLGWDVGIGREKYRNTGIKFCPDHILTLLCTTLMYYELLVPKEMKLVSFIHHHLCVFSSYPVLGN